MPCTLQTVLPARCRNLKRLVLAFVRIEGLPDGDNVQYADSVLSTVLQELTALQVGECLVRKCVDSHFALSIGFELASVVRIQISLCCDCCSRCSY